MDVALLSQGLVPVVSVLSIAPVVDVLCIEGASQCVLRQIVPRPPARVVWLVLAWRTALTLSVLESHLTRIILQLPDPNL